MARAALAEGGRVLFWCPGCEEGHAIGPEWTWNGSTTAPTFRPSVKVTGVQWAMGQAFRKNTHAQVPAGEQTICHSFVTDGRIEFLGDCTHELAGQTVDLPTWPYGGERP